MIANPEKFHAILHRKSQTSTSGEKVNIDGEIINSDETLKLPHISNICKKAATQLNVLQRLKLFIDFKEKKLLFKAFSFQILSIVLWYVFFIL